MGQPPTLENRSRGYRLIACGFLDALPLAGTHSVRPRQSEGGGYLEAVRGPATSHSRRASGNIPNTELRSSILQGPLPGAMKDSSGRQEQKVMFEQSHPKPPTSFVIKMALCACVNSALLGYDTGVLSGALLYLRDAMDLSTQQVSFVIELTTTLCAPVLPATPLRYVNSHPMWASRYSTVA
eukprot:548244-Amorphochlora_amoeboformis.AAC.1